jgi:hypothetical protein
VTCVVLVRYVPATDQPLATPCLAIALPMSLDADTMAIRIS